MSMVSAGPAWQVHLAQQARDSSSLKVHINSKHPLEVWLKLSL
jgi:hypothetical protein